MDKYPELIFLVFVMSTLVMRTSEDLESFLPSDNEFVINSSE